MMSTLSRATSRPQSNGSKLPHTCRSRYPSGSAHLGGERISRCLNPPPVPQASSGYTILFGSGYAGLGALHPAPYAQAVATIDITERALEIGFLAGHYPVADDEREGHQHHQ